jgi:hypothetical protein
MNECGYGASEFEQEINDLEDLHDRIYSLSEEIEDIFSDLDEKYDFGIVVRLQDMAFDVRLKETELRIQDEHALESDQTTRNQV